jgi:hypothetical protein
MTTIMHFAAKLSDPQFKHHPQYTPVDFFFEIKVDKTRWRDLSNYVVGVFTYNGLDDAISHHCRQHLQKNGLTVHKSSQSDVIFEVYEIKLVNGQTVRNLYKKKHGVAAPIRPTTEEEFYEEQRQALEQLPPEFRKFVSSHAWSENHAYGYDEVLSKVTDLTNELAGCVSSYNLRIMREKTSQCKDY